MPICPTCGQENPEVARFCLNCGTALAAETALAREERKVVTVLFCDLVGSTARAEGADPEDVRALLSAYHERVRSELERFGGTVEKFIGDAVMALFGAPTAHEDDPERAVRAALAIRDWAAEDGDLQVRIGITTGEALVALGVNPQAGEGMASGDVVNTAARLQAAAPENGILVDETTLRATHEVVDYEDVDPVSAKGKAEPIGVWQAQRARSRLGVDVARLHTTPLVGRGRELSVLRETLRRTLHEHSPQLITIIGAPGIGKSRLVFELMQLVADEPELVVWRQGRSLPYGDGVSFWSLSEIVKAQAGILEGDSDEDAARKLARAAAHAVEEDVDWVLRHLRPLAGLETEDSAEERRAERFSAWRRFFETLAGRSPVVLVFEDLHWADDGLLDFVDHLAEWVSGVPLLLVGTARPELLERRPAWGGGKLNATTLALAPLSERETARLVHSLLEAPVEANRQDELLGRAGGNPLYAEQYARMLSERGDTGELPLPESVQGIIAARLDALPAAEKRLLQDASVIGEVFWTGSLGFLEAVESWELEELLHSLERKDFLQRARRSSVAGSTEYSFDHVLVRDVAYGQVPRRLRAERHRAAAAWIESLGRTEDHAEMLAHHYVVALELSRATGADTATLELPTRLALRAAGDRAVALNVFASALRYYEQALKLWPVGDPGRPPLLLRYGSALRVAKRRGHEELAEARDAFLAARDFERAAEAETAIGELLTETDEPARALEHLERAVELAREFPQSRTKAYALAALSRLQAASGMEGDAIRHGEEALAIAETLGLDDLSAYALNNIGLARFFIGDLSGSIEALERSLELALAANSPDCVRSYWNLSSGLGVADDLAGEETLVEEGLRAAERFGSTFYARTFRETFVMRNLRSGHWDEALQVDEELRRAPGDRPDWLEAYRRMARAWIRLARDDVQGALDEAEAMLAAYRERVRKQIDLAGAVLTAYGFFLLVTGHDSMARAAADELVSTLRGTRHPLGGSANTDPAMIAFLLVGLGRAGDLESILEPIPPTRWKDAAQRVAIGDLVAAADVYAELGCCHVEAYVRLRAAEQLVAERRTAEADVQLEKALRFHRSVSATRYIREGEALLAKTA
jgi:class 3 adenylate cyclase/tetratricopeptide (TPR) repeat protein